MLISPLAQTQSLKSLLSFSLNCNRAYIVPKTFILTPLSHLEIWRRFHNSTYLSHATARGQSRLRMSISTQPRSVEINSSLRYCWHLVQGSWTSLKQAFPFKINKWDRKNSTGEARHLHYLA